MDAGFSIEKGIYGSCMKLLGPWDPHFRDIMQQQNIRELRLNEAWGWNSGSLSFLTELTFLEGFFILDWNICNLESIHSLNKLRYLSIEVSSKAHVDFTCFPKLERCFTFWYPGTTSILDCTWLKRLHINSYKGKNSYDFERLVNLEWFEVGNGPLPDIQGLSVLTKLKHLELFLFRKLTSLAGIENLSNLHYLDIECCRAIRRIDEIRYLRNLAFFGVNNCGDIESLEPITGLPNLRELFFIESTNILDSDMSPIATLPKLRRLAYANRKHYSQRNEEFPAYFGQRIEGEFE